MKIPPNMKRRVVQQPGFCFTELSLSDAELAQLCVIPSRAAAVPVPLPVLRRGRRTVHGGRAAMAAGLALLAFPSCTTLGPPALVEATVEVVQLAAAASSIEKTVVVAPNRHLLEAFRIEIPARGRAARLGERRVPPVVDSALLVRADRALSAGQYRAALAMYRKLIRREPARVEALFGAALAAHELKQTRDSTAYLERTLTHRPDHPLANVLAGFVDQLGRRYDQARERYSRFLEVEGAGDQADEIRAVIASLPRPAGVTVTGSR